VLMQFENVPDEVRVTSGAALRFDGADANPHQGPLFRECNGRRSALDDMASHPVPGRPRRIHRTPPCGPRKTRWAVWSTGC